MNYKGDTNVLNFMVAAGTNVMDGRTALPGTTVQE
jgi:hypothetical protein